MKTWPLFVRKFIVDTVETGLAALLAVTIVFPVTVDDVTREAAVVGVALVGAVISAVRRAVPDFLTWLREKLDLNVP
jgi:hypothetical protein